jgi:hypothetical protein
MGYIGLLLNAPYKIDSMVWMMLMMISFLLSDNSVFCLLSRLGKPGDKIGCRALKWGCLGF